MRRRGIQVRQIVLHVEVEDLTPLGYKGHVDFLSMVVGETKVEKTPELVNRTIIY